VAEFQKRIKHVLKVVARRLINHAPTQLWSSRASTTCPKFKKMDAIIDQNRTNPEPQHIPKRSVQTRGKSAVTHCASASATIISTAGGNVPDDRSLRRRRVNALPLPLWVAGRSSNDPNE
jgi:hypothetical protein